LKKILPKEVHICDGCGKEEYCHACIGCGVEYCYDCRKKLMVEYKHSVYASGTGDGDFCLKCNSTPPPKVRDLLYAYYTIKNLKSEEDSWHKDFRKRSDMAEEILKQRRKEIGL